MNTYATKPSDIERKWYVVDAQGVVLGRLAAEVAKILRGKHKPSFVPNLDCGDYVIVINAITNTPVGSAELKKPPLPKFWPDSFRAALSKRLLKE